MLFERDQTICFACLKPIIFTRDYIRHHISYFPERIVFVHKSCHSFIHNSHPSRYPELLPDMRQTIRWYRKKGVRYHVDAFPYTINLFFKSLD